MGGDDLRGTGEMAANLTRQSEPRQISWRLLPLIPSRFDGSIGVQIPGLARIHGRHMKA
jgi:hypothetical protein